MPAAVPITMIASSALSAKMASDASSKAAQTAANAQVSSSSQATQAQLMMWEQARQDFAPYLNAGRDGLAKLQYSLPGYIETTITPLAQAYAGYQPQALPSSNYTINPVTGQINMQQMPQAAQTQTAQPQAAQPQQNAFTLNQSNQSAAANSNKLWDKYRDIVGKGGAAKVVTDPYTWLSSSNKKLSAAQKQQAQNIMQTGTPGSVQTITGSNGAQYVFAVPNRASTTQTQPRIATQTQPRIASQQQTAQNQMMPVVSQQDLTSGGVLSPLAPTLRQDLNYQFSTEDPIYQQKLAEKTKQINAFLAKQGLLDSSAGETFRQNELNRLMAEEDERQYSRALTERNYGTQTTADQYAMEAARGDTLYNRIYGQQSDLYSRMLQGTMLSNQQNLDTLARPYGVAQDIYNTMYGGAANLANIGSNAAGNTGQQALSTGQGVASNLLTSGNAMAQSALAQGQNTAQMWNMLGTLPSQYMTYSNYLNPTPQTNTVYPQTYGYSGSPSSINQSNMTGLNYY